MDIPETLYVVYDINNNEIATDCFYVRVCDAVNELHSLEELYPDNKYRLIGYRRCIICDA